MTVTDATQNGDAVDVLTCSAEAGLGEERAPARGRAQPEQRRLLLGEESSVLGTSWAQSWRTRVSTEGRALMGGWPGTLPEARAKALEHFDRELSRRGLPSLSFDELALVTTMTYAQAKSDWLCAVQAVKRRLKSE